MSAGFELAGTRYEWFPLDRIQVREQIKVEHWLNRDGKEFTDARTWDDLQAIAVEIDSLPDYPAQQKHPEFKLSLAITIWAAKLGAGEQVTLGDELGRWTWEQLDFWRDEEEPEGKGPAAP